MSNRRKRPFWVTLLIALAIGSLLYFGNVELQTWLGERALDASGLEPHTALAPALEAAQEAGKPVFVGVSAIWCPSCRSFDKRVLSDPAVVQRISEDYVFARLEYESQGGQEMLARLQATGFPHYAVLAPSGDVITRMDHRVDAATFADRLDAVRADL